MYYIVSQIRIDERFLENCFYCDSQQIISPETSDSLIPDNLIKRAQETEPLRL